MKNVLITGGAGFIGSHLADELLRAGYGVRVMDVLLPQVHGPGRNRPAYLDPRVELYVGDVRSAEHVRPALEGVDAVFHFAASVGVGQSMYEIASYVSANDLGTAVLLEAVVAQSVKRLIVASSMSVYGEGLYRDVDGVARPAGERTLDRLRAGSWELEDAQRRPLVPTPTPEWKRPSLASVYALSKYDQEQLCLLVGKAYGIRTVALRFFNVYGTRQALSNPYTGVLAIFASRILNGNPPLVFEDGMQRRDFVNVRDVVRACRLALESENADGQVLNIGSGESRAVLDVAVEVAAALDRADLDPEVTGRFRVGDVRHCFADVSLARSVLGFEPRVSFTAGLAELVGWLRGQTAADRVLEARAELEARGLSG